jgi:hypothetical protein
MVQVAPCLRAGQASMSAAIAELIINFSSLRSSRWRTATAFWFAFLVSEAARLRHGRDTEVSRPGLQRGRAKTRRHRAYTCTHASRQASALFRLRPSGSPDSGIDSPALPPLHSTPRPLKMKQASAAFVPLATNCRDNQEQLGRSQIKGRYGTHRPRDFVRPRHHQYGRDAPHVAQDTDIAVRRTSFVSLRSQTGRPH